MTTTTMVQSNKRSCALYAYLFIFALLVPKMLTEYFVVHRHTIFSPFKPLGNERNTRTFPLCPWCVVRGATVLQCV